MFSPPASPASGDHGLGHRRDLWDDGLGHRRDLCETAVTFGAGLLPDHCQWLSDRKPPPMLALK